MSDPLITIGITCYRERDWLLECWESVLAQTDDRWEAVLVMDGAADQRTREIFERINHPKLRKYEMPYNVGPYPTRNKAFDLTHTPYHFYLDADDRLLPHTVGTVLEGFANHPNAGVVYGDYQLFGGHEGVWSYPHHPTPDMLVNGQCIPCGGGYKKELWQQLGGFAPELAYGNGDYDFMIGVIEHGVEVYHCGRVLCLYRTGHSGSVSASYRKKYHETHEIMVQRHPKFFENACRRNKFLAIGYSIAARANYAAGDKGRAAELARVAFRKGLWHDPEVLYLAGGTCLPTWGYGGLVKVRSLWRRAAGRRLKRERTGG